MKTTLPLLVLVLLGGLVRAGDAANLTRITWIDPATNLMWAKQDSRSDLEWYRANQYCSNLGLGGYSNWRLPTIDELEGIYDQTQNVNGWHIKGGIKLSGWAWSSSNGNAKGEAWFFGFDNGVRFSRPRSFRYLDRALCVRSLETRSGAARP
jgi:hypothetical protein